MSAGCGLRLAATAHCKAADEQLGKDDAAACRLTEIMPSCKNNTFGQMLVVQDCMVDTTKAICSKKERSASMLPAPDAHAGLAAVHIQQPCLAPLHGLCAHLCCGFDDTAGKRGWKLTAEASGEDAAQHWQRPPQLLYGRVAKQCLYVELVVCDREKA